jgi:hypothetical protein
MTREWVKRLHSGNGRDKPFAACALASTWPPTVYAERLGTSLLLQFANSQPPEPSDAIAIFHNCVHCLLIELK